MLVQKEEVEFYMVVVLLMKNDGNWPSVENKRSKTLPHPTFYIMVADTSKVSIRLFKNMKVATLSDALSEIIFEQEQIPVDFVIAVPIYKGKQKRERQSDQHQQLTKSFKKNQEVDRRN